MNRPHHVIFALLVVGWLTPLATAQQPPSEVRAHGSCRLMLQTCEVDTRSEPNLLEAPDAELGGLDTVVLQLKGAITAAQRARLNALGVVLYDYLPDHAYLADVRRVSRSELAKIPFVQWVGKYQRGWKKSPKIGLRTAAFETTERIRLAKSNRVRLIVTLFAHKGVGRSTAAIRKTGAKILGQDEVAGCTELYVEAPGHVVDALADIPGVQFIEEAPEITLRNNTTRWIVQSNVANLTPFYDNGIHGEDQIIGVIDGQPDKDHCALDDGKFLFYNSSDGNSFHGTHVAGTVAGDNGVFDDRRGVAFAANMVFNTTPSFTESGIMQRLTLHHDQGARIHTNSWGDDGTTSYNGLCRGFDAFLYQNEEDFVCLAVTNGAVLRNPENAKNLLAVGASRDTPQQDFHCSGGRGPTEDGRRKPEVYAPGCSTVSTVPSACSVSANTGTSMACPAVGGAAALVRQYFVDGYYPSGFPNLLDSRTPSGALIKAVLTNSAVDMTGISGYPSDLEGWGRLLADNAVFFPGDTRNLVVIADPRNAVGLSTGQNGDHTFAVVGSGEQLRVTLVWTDPPASASTGSGAALVNNLDLEVVSPDGQLYRGNFFIAGESVANGAADPVNNVEQVHISAPMMGEWSVRVAGTAVNQGTQGYALIATGAVAGQVPDCNTNGVPDYDDIAFATSPDCDLNGVPDECQPATDCNTNGVWDFCDIANESSDDCSGNGIPDECEMDCNGNGVADSCDILGPQSNDCNANDIPDECESDCNSNGVPDDCDVAQGDADCNENGLPDSCELSGNFGHDCCTAHNAGGCNDPQIESCVCASDPFCCDVIWDGICVYRVEELECGVCTQPDDCDSNGVPDECQGDCNETGVADACEISAGSSDDCNANSIPDECEPGDCNNNGVLDECDLAAATSVDCNANLVPDECELDAVGPGDCCEVEHGGGCSNLTIEACVCEDFPSCCDDVWDETCVFLVTQFGCGVCDQDIDPDCDGNGILDSCENPTDCNNNNVPDFCDLPDCNTNGLPDDCETEGLIVQQPTSEPMCPGSLVQLSVAAPDASDFQWFKDDVPVSDGGVISGATTGTLSVSNVGPSQLGTYRCEVFAGCVSLLSDPVDITFLADPTFDVQPGASLSACPGTSTIMTVEASGLQLDYQWYRNGDALQNGAGISGATSPALTLANLSISDGADAPGYTCVVTDSCGRSLESDPSVLSIVAPQFSQHPTDLCVDEGQPAEFSASATSPPGTTQITQWFKDGSPLSDGNGISGVFTETLTITDVMSGDAGAYSMRALAFGLNCIEFSESAMLTVGDCCPLAGDMDGDGDYDLADMQQFTICFGANRQTNPACRCADVDGENDIIDLSDWASFSELLDGP